MKRIALVAAMSAALAIFATPARAECSTLVGSADMVTRDLAKFMAEAALKNAIAAKGLQPAGEMSMKCRDDTFTTYCKATRRACR
jgi:hypothetical protein